MTIQPAPRPASTSRRPRSRARTVTVRAAQRELAQAMDLEAVRIEDERAAIVRGLAADPATLLRTLPDLVRRARRLAEQEAA